ncbi:MAG: adenylate kinase [Halanaerobiaceae bacterium]
MIIVFLGLPGAGKGTQAKFLSNKYNMNHISTGDIFREAIKKGTPLGEKAKTYMDKGDLVPDEITIGLVENKVEEFEEDEDYIFDGFPRTLNQAKALTEILEKENIRVNLCIFIKVDEDELVIRISGRRICEECGAIYHVEFNPPEEEGICDKCGGSLYQRKDDEEETVRNRIKTNKKETMPLVHYYKDRGVLETIVGTDQMPEDVSHQLQGIIEVRMND